MEYSVLGPLRVSNGDGAVEIRGAKERTLLAHLLASRGQMVPTTALVESLWGDEPPRSAAKSVQTYVLRLRNALEPARAGSPRLLMTEGPGYRLVADPADVDAERFARLAALGRRALQDGRADVATATLEEALGLWRGPAYAGFEETAFGQAESRRLAELRLTALEDRWAAELDRGRAVVAAPELERLLAGHPLRERLWYLLVLALYRCDRQGDALAAYERARTVLADELGVDPGDELRGLHARVLAQDPALRADRRATVLPGPLVPPPHPLVGRDAELAVLRRAWEHAQAGGPATVVVRGGAGAGATRLAQALADEVSHAGHPVVLVTAADLREERAGAPDVGSGARPGLWVADHVPPPEPAPAGLTLVLAPPGAAVPPDAPVVDLRPLDDDAVRRIVAQYVPGGYADACAEVRARTGGWPGAVHEEALRLGREAAVQRVQVAASLADRSSAALGSARAELVDGVETLNEATRPPAPAPDVCPWRGLASYGVADAAWYCGRERLVAELVARVAGTRLLGVVGSSGSGKSSAVHAGLLASLAADVLPGSGMWTPVVLRPGPHPMRELTRQALGQRHVEVGDLLAHLIRPDAVADGARLVLVVDQLEEVWTACDDPGERAAFLDTLVELAEDPRSPVTVVLVLRADFVGEVAEHGRLAAMLADSTVLVGSPTPAEVRRAVERPAQRAGLRLDDGLADALVSDAGDEPGLLPLLSTALTHLWERRSGRDLTFAAYVGAGGLQGAITHLAEAAYAGLTPAEQEAARLLLLRLTGPGEEASVTRRRVALAELDGLPHADLLRRVVAVLTGARLLTASDGHVEVAHEALFREWPRLRGWLVEDAAGRAVQRRLAVAASEWEADGRDPAHLWRGARLESGLEVAQHRPEEVTAAERAFLEAGRDAVDADRRAAEQRAATTARQNRRLRRVLVGLGLLLVVALVAGLAAVRSRAEAVQATESAEARRLAATAVNEEYLDLALLTAVEAVQMERSPETLGALLTLLAGSPDIVTQTAASDRFLRAAVSPDGRTVYLGENDSVLHAVDAVTGERRWLIRTRTQPITLDHGPGGLLVGGIGDPFPAITLLDPATGEEVWSVGLEDLREVLGAEVVSQFSSGVRWLPDGRIAAPLTTGVLLLHPDGTVAGTVPWGRDVELELLTAWPDGRVGIGTLAGEGFVVDPAQPDAAPVPLPGVVLAASSTGTLLVRNAVSATAGATVDLYDAATLERVPLPRPMRPTEVRSAAFSPDGAVLAVGDGELLRLYDVTSGQEIGEHAGHSGFVMGIVFAGADRDIIWTAGRDGSGIAWDLSGRRGAVRTRPYALATARGDVASATGVAIALARQPGTEFLHTADLHLVDTTTGDRLATLAHPDVCPCNLVAADISADGTTAVAGLEVQMQPDAEGHVDGQDHLAVYDVPTGRLRTTIAVPWHTLGIGLSPDGDRAVVGGHLGYGVVDLVRGRVVRATSGDDEMYHDVTQSAEVSPDGARAVVGRDGALLLVDMASGEVLTRVRTERSDPSAPGITANPGRALTFAWTPDGRAVAAGDSHGTVSFLDGHTLEPVAPARTMQGGWLLDLEVSRDGRLLASLGTDGNLVLWDTATWKPLGQPVSDARHWGLLAFDPEQPVLRALHETGELVELSVDPDVWVRDACRVANRGFTAEEAANVLPGREPSGTCAPTLDRTASSSAAG